MNTPNEETTWLNAAWMQRGLNAMKRAYDVPEKAEMIKWLLESGMWDKEKLSWDAAVSKFNDYFNPEKPRRMPHSESLALAVQFNRPEYYLYCLEVMGYEEPRKKSTAERIQELLEKTVRLLEQNNFNVGALLADLQRFGSFPELRVHPRFVERAGTFALADEDTTESQLPTF